MKKKQSYEQSVARLEEIVALLGSGDMDLDISLKLFSEGTELITSCEKQLNEAKLTVEKLMLPIDAEVDDE